MSVMLAMPFCIKKSLCLLVLSLLCLSGCECWPPQSTGGYAGHYLLTGSYEKQLSPKGPYFALAHRYAKLTRELCQLQNSHARRCYPSRFRLLGLLDQQITQEIAAGLCLSANHDLILFERNLANIRKMNSLKGCPKLKQDMDWEILQARIT